MKYIILFFLGITTNFMIAQDTKASEILKKVNEQLNKNKTYQYNYTYNGWGKNYGRFKGDVYIDKNEGLYLGVSLKTLNKNGGEVLDEFIYTDGSELKLLDKTNNKLKIGSVSNGSSYLMSYAWYAVFREFLMPDPFSNRFQDETLKYEGTITIDGKECHKVSYVNQWGDINTWYFGKDDNQIYGQKTENQNPQTKGGFEFIMKSSKFNHKIDQTIFEVVYNDAKIVNEDERIIAVGEKAPEWSLRTSNNAILSSRQLKGKIVLLDFWASWCSPCWKIMPIINKIKSDYKDKGLIVYGVNVWENPSLNLKEYLNKKGLNAYENLIDKDASTAKSFKLGSLPFIVLIDKDGTILYTNSGADSNLDDSIRMILNNKM